MAGALVPMANMATDGLDPRQNTVERHNDDVYHMDTYDHKTLNSQPLEIYEYYAAIEREHEANDTRPMEGTTWTRLYRRVFSQQKQEPIIDETHRLEKQPGADPETELSEKKGKDGETTKVSIISDNERFHAYRALRSASWQGIFFLITTDILGPSSAPYAISLTGWGGGILAYTFLWILAIGAGQILFHLYCRTDSARYPVKNFADLGERLFGRFFRHLCNIIQSLQLVLNVAILVLGNGQTLAQIVDYKLCFSVSVMIWTVVGIILGQIRSLRQIGWLANWNIWLNIVVIIMTIVGCAKYNPIPTLNFPSLTPPYPPITHTSFAPSGTGWYPQVSGVSIMVFAYGGAMIFVEFMSEMRRPMDFWKAALTAQTFIYVVYMIYGCVIYKYQGQYSYIIPSLSIDNHGYLLAVNIIGLLNTIIAAILYGNIGIKIFYYNVLQEYFGAPDLITKRGWFYWSITTFFYWGFAFVFGSAIPQLSSMTTLVGAVCILQFTYTFPPLMLLGYLTQKDAMKADSPWEPGMAPWSNRIDSWKDASRWKRGLKRNLPFKIFLFLLFLASLAFCGLGAYAGVEGIIDTFAAEGSATSFGCRTPGES